MNDRYIRISTTGLVVRDDHVLLGRGDWPKPGTYWLPGGGQQPGETLAACIEREVLEETGVRVTAGPLIQLREHIPWNHPDSPSTPHVHRVEALFWCHFVEEPDTLGATVPDDVQTGAEWIPLDKLTGLRFMPPSVQASLPELIAQAGGLNGFYTGDVA
ncbi:NUDIX domain-containing protein [Streptomyces sp. UNOB3_S3]|uniref:NUDIX domain-containing protein n=1 Tax=Streptomyces sp. UNOB3_S3 TaxID=2871682 RepID=UPI001E53A557|nr:NUDIX domain-containing protein [Streptomyces sp. UNOB3_S3]MCC3773811.1 NUDIX domain-containing protein [Streptomyces sp. UNOB3_S3]